MCLSRASLILRRDLRLGQLLWYSFRSYEDVDPEGSLDLSERQHEEIARHGQQEITS